MAVVIDSDVSVCDKDEAGRVLKTTERRCPVVGHDSIQTSKHFICTETSLTSFIDY